jgi:hypothetical protein
MKRVLEFLGRKPAVWAVVAFLLWWGAFMFIFNLMGG